MSIVLSAVHVIHERRVRAIFTNTLASGAFGAPAPAFYGVENIDGLGPSPAIQAALIVPGNGAVVELVLSQPLANGALYQLTAIGVPAVDSSVTPDPSDLQFRWGDVVQKENVEPKIRDRDRLLYGTDLLWNGLDFQENALGDLDSVSGTPNVAKALNRGAEADGLPWDPTYGARMREYVDSPSTAAGTLKGSLTAQLLRDPRVKSVKVTFEIKDDQTFVYADPKLVSGEVAKRVTVVVPNQ